MKKRASKKKIEKLFEMYQNYKSFKKISDIVMKKQLPPLTLDQQIESINPYYVRSETVKYG